MIAFGRIEDREARMKIHAEDWGMENVRSNRPDGWPFITAEQAASAPPIGRTRDDDRHGLARRIRLFCALRQESFGGIIHDAPFNLLIDMYLSELTNRRVTVGDACIASRAPQTTALRAIQTLIDGGTIQRTDDMNDNRRKLLSLTDKGRDQVTRFVDRFAASGAFEG
jgi:hypothetical protein